MNEELREKVARELYRWGWQEPAMLEDWDNTEQSYRDDCMKEAPAILRLFASLLVKAQREAFVAGWLAAYDNTNFNVHTEAIRRYPEVQP